MLLTIAVESQTVLIMLISSLVKPKYTGEGAYAANKVMAYKRLSDVPSKPRMFQPTA